MRAFTKTILLVSLQLLAAGRLGADNAYLMRASLPPVDPGSELGVVRDAAPGAGIFDSTPGPHGAGYPVMSLGNSGTCHCLHLAPGLTDRLRYSRMSPWGSWDSSIAITPSGYDPGYPTFNIAASKVSSKVVVTWVYDDTTPSPAFYRLSTDDGSTWGEVTQLDYPPAFGTDTTVSFHLSSLSAFWGEYDRLHFAASVYPVVHDTGFVTPAQIWHWCSNNNPCWSRIARAQTSREHLAAPVGYNALLASRPSLCRVQRDEINAVWEQFDSAAVEPGLPPRLRSDVYIARSVDNGSTWGPGIKLTADFAHSCRFPSLAHEIYQDSTWLTFVTDLAPGLYASGEGTMTENPVIVSRVPWQLYFTPRCETVGGTTYDMQTIGPAHQVIIIDSVYGVHVAWQRSALVYPFSDLNVRYDFYDFATCAWNFTDSSFMNSGLGAFPRRIGQGTLDVNSGSSAEYLAGSTFIPVGVDEHQGRLTRHSSGPSIVRSGLSLPVDSRARKFDITGRAVAGPGSDCARPGIYFVQSPGEARARKVIVE